MKRVLGDIAFRFIDFVRHSKSSSDTVGDSHVTVCDINQAMLDVGERKAASRGRSQSFTFIIIFSLLFITFQNLVILWISCC